ncbi:Queuine tRNA-ribosyltransferase [Gracilariopsis chorda]|uniref:Queuine tRNA-ribosyltransferase n=1 Tax=Gracilariopsis chorda TaxID=448386 RepID=A0A2V3J2R0_9FLOR|nr:Queuine tRNA-ribosyltransferase [Gracilariopsis chorda]|eukprot:PXF48736.1 Queuine tRNA-ribosyltransferase [Gracilariopsis chorda]
MSVKESGARVHEIRSGSLRQQTPAPLLVTQKGQLPYLPVPLAQRATPQGATRLHSLPISDWHTLNSNNNLRGTDLFRHLNLSAKSATCSQDVILFLTLRTVGTDGFLSDTAGKKEVVSFVCDGSQRLRIGCKDVADLAVAMKTDFCVSLSDGMPLYNSVNERVLQRRANRNEKLQKSFIRCAQEGGVNGVVIAVQGGDCPSTRRRVAEGAARAATLCNAAAFAIEGLYAGESAETRFKCVEAVTRAVHGTGLPVLLLGGSGAPWEVLRAVAAGVDIVESDYPFEAAENGLALQLTSAKRPLAIRERQNTLCTEPIARDCGCACCKGGAVSVGYLRHLLEVREMSGVSLLAAHNLWQFLCWFHALREAVDHQRLDSFAARFATRPY